jgi:hypothetical protein
VWNPAVPTMCEATVCWLPIVCRAAICRRPTLGFRCLLISFLVPLSQPHARENAIILASKP